MLSSSLPRHRFAPWLVIGMLLAAFSLVIAPAAASAHDRLTGSSPEADSTVDTLPAELTLTFSANLIDGPNATQIEVTAADGRAAHAGEPVVSGQTVTVPLIAEAPAGVYQVVWRVVSSDTHPISGEFSFEVRTSTETVPVPSAEPTPELPPTQIPNPTEGTPADGESFLRNLPLILGGIAVAALGGALIAFLLARARRGGKSTSDEG